MATTLYSLPCHKVTEFYRYIVLDSLVPHYLLHGHPHRGGVRVATSEHMNQGILHMEAFILAPDHTETNISQSVNSFNYCHTSQGLPHQITCIQYTCSSRPPHS